MTARSFTGSARIDSERGHRLAQLRHLLVELGAPEPGQATERHVQDVPTLLLAEGEGLGHQGLKAEGRSSELRMVAITASSMSSARSSPSTMWARLRALSSRNCVRRVTTSIWCAM